jgi:valyl-tRNA synthetase
MDRYECRKALVEKIKEEGHLVKIEKIVHSVGHSERSDAVVEPMLSKQWFVKMKPLAEKPSKSKDGAKSSSSRTALRMCLTRWMKEVEDWCISRQLWWGHRIPAYYNKKTGEVLVSETEPDPESYTAGRRRFGYLVLERPLALRDDGLARYHFARLSALFPDQFPQHRLRHHLLLGLAHDVPVAPFHRRSALQAGRDPWLIRDEPGPQDVEVLGNGIDPLDVIAKYGVDAMRYFITTNTTPGMDMTYSEEKLESAEAYLNKIWNACRYVEGVLGEDFKAAPLEEFLLELPRDEQDRPLHGGKEEATTKQVLAYVNKAISS